LKLAKTGGIQTQQQQVANDSNGRYSIQTLFHFLPPWTAISSLVVRVQVSRLV